MDKIPFHRSIDLLDTVLAEKLKRWLSDRDEAGETYVRNTMAEIIVSYFGSVVQWNYTQQAHWSLIVFGVASLADGQQPRTLSKAGQEYADWLLDGIDGTAILARDLRDILAENEWDLSALPPVEQLMWERFESLPKVRNASELKRYRNVTDRQIEA